MTDIEKRSFETIAKDFLASEQFVQNNIGTYKEKALHAITKRYISEDVETHEIKIGTYITDVFLGSEIFEIQTGSFYPMVDKLRYYLEHTDYTISVIRPIYCTKWCNWIDKRTSEITSRRKSPKSMTPISVMRDWLFISDFIKNPRLKIRFLFLEVEEYRFLDGWSRDRKRGSNRYEIIPTKLIDEEVYSSPEDYRKFIPASLGETFFAADFVKANKLTPICGNAALKLLCNIDLLERKKQGRAYLYYRK